jgi:putative heme iron utilization protein
MMTRSYGVAIVMPAEGKTDDVKAALENYVQGQQLSMENYLVDQYEIAQAATVTVVPTGEVVLVCSENGDEVLASIEAALAA